MEKKWSYSKKKWILFLRSKIKDTIFLLFFPKKEIKCFNNNRTQRNGPELGFPKPPLQYQLVPKGKYITRLGNTC